MAVILLVITGPQSQTPNRHELILIITISSSHILIVIDALSYLLSYHSDEPPLALDLSFFSPLVFLQFL